MASLEPLFKLGKMPSSGFTSEAILSSYDAVVECLRGDGGRGTEVDVAMCSDTRLSREIEIGFWFVGRGKRLIGADEERLLVVLESWPVPVLFLWMDLDGDLSRVTYVLDQESCGCWPSFCVHFTTGATHVLRACRGRCTQWELTDRGAATFTAGTNNDVSTSPAESHLL